MSLVTTYLGFHELTVYDVVWNLHTDENLLENGCNHKLQNKRSGPQSKQRRPSKLSPRRYSRFWPVATAIAARQ